MKREPARSYSDRLSADRKWGRMDASAYFDREGSVFETLRHLHGIIVENNIDYCIHGALGLYLHGFRRFTMSIDLVSTDFQLTLLQTLLPEDDYNLFDDKGRTIRHRSTGVDICYWTWSDLKALSPTLAETNDPLDAMSLIGEYPVLSLACSIECKMSLAKRPASLRHSADVQDAIKHLHLSKEFARQLNLDFREQYLQLWNYAQMDRSYEH